MKIFYSVCLSVLMSGIVVAQDHAHLSDEVTFIQDRQRMPDVEWQSALRNTPAWQSFLDRNGTWYVEFNEENMLPHKAYGKPIATSGNSAQDRALSFISSELSAYNVDIASLSVISTPKTSKHTYVHFAQRYNGMDVLGGKVSVKLDQNSHVIGFTLDVYDMSDAIASPVITVNDAIASGSQSLTGIVGSSISGMATLPLPKHRGYNARLVYVIEVHTQNGVLPGHYVCYVDAENGQLLYRTNKVMNHDHNKCSSHKPNPPVATDVVINANVFEVQPYIPATVQPLRNLTGTIGGQNFTTDQNGAISTSITGPVTANFDLSGDWSTIYTNGVTPSMTATLQDGANTVSFDNDANDKELSAYFHVNIVHDHMKSVIPSFTGMDFSLTTNVDVGGNCNAFYDGSSINFYAEGNDCHSWAKLGEVVYHEYGHGINDFFYQSLGSNFSNGAMNEGYADIWALTITQDPILAEGNSLSDPNDYIRRYDINPKVYPVDISGSVHGDGEIIAGAWWDTYLLLGNNLSLTLQLFADAFPGLQANTFNGNEGVAYRDVLIDVLQADDNDGDITNGTPNGTAIVDAFAIHGITLLSNATLSHTAIDASPENQDITINADLTLQFPFTNYLSDVTLFYKVNNSSSYLTIPMTNPSGSNWEADIPGQPQGSIIAYYMGVTDIFGQLSAVTPSGAAKPNDPNIPNFILVDMQVELTDDGDFFNELGNWETGLAGDDATTGIWEYTIPIGSFIDPTDPTTAVQPADQHTPGGEFCFVTGNAQTPTDGLGVNDVDAGTTTLRSDIIDLTTFNNPIVTYYRWWSNNTGALPNEDPLEVAISDDGGNTWQFVEYTRTSDRSWRKFAFRVSDYLTVNDQFRIKFNASDSTIYGGSLVEAAIDDIQIWDDAEPQSVGELNAVDIIGLFPDPASEILNLNLDLSGDKRVNVEIIDMTGRIVLTQDLGILSGKQMGVLNVASLAEGQYSLKVNWKGGSAQDNFLILR